MFKNLPLLAIILLSALSVACVSQDEKVDFNEPGALDLILCENPRPEICTREYNPVCATLVDGGQRTGSTGCTACSDPKVVGYRMGKCELVTQNSSKK
jgi:hypothetical protein